MDNPPFDHPEARRKRAEKLNREAELTLAAWAKNLPVVNDVTDAPPPAMGTIYFVGPKGGPVKIGFARRLEFRLKDLRTMNAFPLIVHASVDGPATMEREYHRRFAAHRLHGEWFEPHPDILAEIARLTPTQEQ